MRRVRRRTGRVMRLFLFFLRRWVVVREVQKLIYPHFSKREKKHRTRRINTITSNKNKNIKRTRKDKRKGYGA